MKRRKWLIFLAVWTCLTGCSRAPFESGDRVLVSKCMYDTDISPPRRFDVVVFKYPVRPIERGTPKNYIKRLLGLPGEILAILFGRIFLLSPGDGDEPFFPEPKVLTTKDGTVYKGFVRKDEGDQVVFENLTFSKHETKRFTRDQIASLQPIPMGDRWKHRPEASSHELGHKPWDPRDRSIYRTVDDTDFDNDFDFMLENNEAMLKWYHEGKFKILRKPPDVMLAMRCIVYDNDFQPKDLSEERFRRWAAADGAWKAQGTDFVSEPKAGTEASWLRYRNLVLMGDRSGERSGRTAAPAPSLITDYYGYNSGDPGRFSSANWVGDLMLECDLEVSDAKGEFLMELSRGIDRFQAKFDLATGQCTLYRVKEKKKTELISKETRVKSAGTYHLRFSNFCSRLTVWVDRDLPFAQGHDYDPPDVPQAGEFPGLNEEQIAEQLSARRGPTSNDLEPASVGIQGAAVTVRHMRLWRDTYYTRDAYGGEESVPVGGEKSVGAEWDDRRRLRPYFYYVQPGHVMCLGDNSTASSDSRDWGLVPERLMLGRAHMVYYPFSRVGPIK